MNVFSTQISMFSNSFDSIGKVVTLGDFLNDGEYYKEKVQVIRHVDSESAKQLKREILPCATISAVCGTNKSVVKHSGLMCLDFDSDYNPHVSDWQDLKRRLSVLPQLAYISLSVRGHGLYAIMPVMYPGKHREHFFQLQEDFLQMGLVIDPSCSNVNRLRYMSYDNAPFVRMDATTYTKYKRPERTTHKTFSPKTDDDVSQLCQMIEHRGIDITQTYDDWYKLGFSLASLGESGRELYHVCSRQYANYKFEETEKKFNNLLQNYNGSITIATFYDVCKKYGLTIAK